MLSGKWRNSKSISTPPVSEVLKVEVPNAGTNSTLDTFSTEGVNTQSRGDERKRYETMRDCIRAVARAYSSTNVAALSAQEVQRLAGMRVESIADAIAWRDAWLALLKRAGSKHGR